MPIAIHDVVHYRAEFPDLKGRYRECRHAEHVIALHLRAKGQYIAGCETISAKAPLLALLPAGERDANSLAGPFDGFWCQFSGEAIRSVPGHLKISLSCGDVSVVRPHTIFLDSAKACAVLRVFQTLLDEWRRPELTARLRALALLHELLAFWSESASPAGHLDGARLFRDLIEQHATNAELSLADLAARVGLCADHLATCFQKEYGIPPVEYRSRVRLALARDLLISSMLPVREIARRCGFADANYFARVFRSRHQTSPAAYRAVNRFVSPS